MKRINLLMSAAIIMASIFASCEKDDDLVGTVDDDDTTSVVDTTADTTVTDTTIDDTVTELKVKKVYIINEGNFQSSDGSISYYDVENDTMYNGVYTAANNVPLGDVVQSMHVKGDTGYICVNNSGKVEVINLTDHSSIAQIEVANPRYFTKNGDYGYVTSQKWGAGQVKVIDLSANVIIDSIVIGSSPEQLAVANGKLYVAKGASGEDSSVAVVDLGTHEVIKTINTGFDGATAVKVDSNGLVWVLAGGKTLYDENWAVTGISASAIVSIDPSTDMIQSTVNLFEGKTLSRMELVNGKVMYAEKGSGIYSFGIDATAAPSTPLITEENYGFTVNPESGVIFVTKANSNLNGTVVRYTSEGTKLNEFEVGVFPNGGTSGKKNLQHRLQD